MGYEVYLTSNSIGSDSVKARRECIAYSMTERGTDSLIRGGGYYLRGSVSAFVFSLSCCIFFSLSCYIMFCTHVAYVSFKGYVLCIFVGFMVCTMLYTTFYALFKSVLLSKCLAFCFKYCHSCALVRLFLDAYT